MEPEYSKRELDGHFNEIKASLKEIQTQVTRTNGRVSNLENWRWFITGGIAILSVMVIPILLATVDRWLS